MFLISFRDHVRVCDLWSPRTMAVLLWWTITFHRSLWSFISLAQKKQNVFGFSRPVHSENSDAFPQSNHIRDHIKGKIEIILSFGPHLVREEWVVDPQIWPQYDTELCTNSGVRTKQEDNYHEMNFALSAWISHFTICQGWGPSLLNFLTHHDRTKNQRTHTLAGTKHRSQVIVLPIQKVSQTLVKANLRPKKLGTDVWTGGTVVLLNISVPFY